MLARLTACFTALAIICSGAAATAAEMIVPKVVIISYFETSRMPGQAAASPSIWGGPPSERPGELVAWVEGEKLTRVIPVEGAFNVAYANADGSILAMKVGPNSLHPAVNIMALGLDPKFDLSKSYWLFNGIAGAAPQSGSVGDVVWTDFVINGGVAHQIDAREMPADWPTGYFAAGKQRPYQQPRVPSGTPEDVRTWPTGRFTHNAARNVIALNRELAAWAYQFTRSTVLADNAAMQAARAAYVGYPAALRPPQVRVGATFSSETFWFGKLMNQWARDWTAYMTDGVAAYATTETNDSGSMVAVSALASAGRIDADRVLLLRGASNFDMQPPNVTALQHFLGDGPGQYAGYLPTLRSIYQVGSPVVRELVTNWDRYEASPPKP
jgi:purine nucleoside permease